MISERTEREWGGDAARADLEECRDESAPGGRADRLRMKLHAVDRSLPMANGHHGPVLTPRRDRESSRNGLGIGDERVVAHGFEWPRQPREDAVSVVMDGARLAVHHFGGTNHAAAELVDDELVSEAHAQDGNVTAELA